MDLNLRKWKSLAGNQNLNYKSTLSLEYKPTSLSEPDGCSLRTKATTLPMWVSLDDQEREREREIREKTLGCVERPRSTIAMRCVAFLSNLLKCSKCEATQTGEGNQRDRERLAVGRFDLYRMLAYGRSDTFGASSESKVDGGACRKSMKVNNSDRILTAPILCRREI